MFISFIILLLPIFAVGQITDVIPPLKIQYIPTPNSNTENTKQENYDEAFDRIVGELNSEVLSKINSTKVIYSSLGDYPERVKDGWHLVTAINEHPQFPSHQEAKVYVTNNKISDIYFSGYSKEELVLSGQIKGGKSFIKIKSTNGASSELMEVFFIDYIVDPITVTLAPEIGYISFWADFKYDGEIFVQISGTQSGYLREYFPKGSYPNSCDEQRVLTLPYKSGTYDFTARTLNPIKVWEGTIIIRKGECGLFRLSK